MEILFWFFEIESSDSEFELMQELLDMIRERNELRKYEQALLLKAKEIEAEDPYWISKTSHSMDTADMYLFYILAYTSSYFISFWSG